jgi:protein ImuA
MFCSYEGFMQPDRNHVVILSEAKDLLSGATARDRQRCAVRHFGSPCEPTAQKILRFAEDDRIAALRQTVARLENAWLGAPPAYLSLGLPDLHHHLPGPGLPCGALHEVIAAAHGDTPAATGFVFAVMACALQARRGPALLVVSRQAADFGRPYGHGLRTFGLDVGRLLLVEARAGKEALWVLEEILRSDAGPAVVAGAVETDLDLTMSRRLNLAAAAAGTPLLLLRPPAAAGTSAATTRWRIAAAPASRDRFGAFGNWRWQVMLERCRNGRAGRWELEWDHVAHRFGVAEVVVDRAPAAGPGDQDVRHAV